ncbi:hypothetical protein E2C01_049736 [Portunus trituberculatus]|uniref:Uncharacterized protein n=1 Tax=Portunus trituberculatus TaxID=210409 RepID=A0A5B7GA94_PORTR|nr:hypothetical protein [Portunus trituberculatus]
MDVTTTRRGDTRVSEDNSWCLAADYTAEMVDEFMNIVNLNFLTACPPSVRSQFTEFINPSHISSSPPGGFMSTFKGHWITASVHLTITTLHRFLFLFLYFLTYRADRSEAEEIKPEKNANALSQSQFWENEWAGCLPLTNNRLECKPSQIKS